MNKSQNVKTLLVFKKILLNFAAKFVSLTSTFFSAAVHPFEGG